MAPGAATRSEKLDLRVTRADKRALQAAAAAARRSVSQFVLESALARAEEALANRTQFALQGAQWNAFLAALDAPPRRLPPAPGRPRERDPRPETDLGRPGIVHGRSPGACRRSRQCGTRGGRWLRRPRSAE